MTPDASLSLLRAEAIKRGLGVAGGPRSDRTIFYQDLAGVHVHVVAEFSRREDALEWLMKQPEREGAQ